MIIESRVLIDHQCRLSVVHDVTYRDEINSICNTRFEITTYRNNSHCALNWENSFIFQGFNKFFKNNEVKKFDHKKSL